MSADGSFGGLGLHPLVVWKLDRIGRSLGHVVELVAGLQAKGIGLKVLTGGIDTTSSAAGE